MATVGDGAKSCVAYRCHTLNFSMLQETSRENLTLSCFKWDIIAEVSIYEVS
jgi:hypothetical protein